MGNSKLPGEPLEQQKYNIVRTLEGMNQNIKDYTKTVEEALMKAYHAGGGKKLGYDQHNTYDAEDRYLDPATAALVDNNKDLNRMKKHA